MIVLFLAVVEFLKEKQIKLGEELDLIVFDNIPCGHLLESPIPFIIHPSYEMGSKAAELLFEQINHKKTAEVFVFPSRMM